MSENIEIKNETIVAPIQPSKDDLAFQKLLQFANLSRYIKKDLNSTSNIVYSFNKKFKREDVQKWMDNPVKYVIQVRNLSRFLYDESMHYKRLIQYFATALTFDYTVEMYGNTQLKFESKEIENIKKRYITVVNFLEVMNIKHEFSKLLERAWIDDVVFGYEHKEKDSYFIEILNTDYCEINGIEDGCLTFAFNFQFFTTYPKELGKYSDEFKEKYKIYQADIRNKKWQELDSTKTICLKINENIDYPIAPLSGLFFPIYELEDYKNLKLSKTELENYLLLVAKIPYLKESGTANNFALEINKAIEYFDLMMDNLPSSVGGILSPFEEITSVKVDKTDKTSDTVSEASKNLYDASGTSQLLFNSASGGASLSKSIINDENISFKVLRQIERWINKKLKDESKVTKFKATFLDITKYSQKDYSNTLKTAATLGVPCKLAYCASLGMSPSDVINNTILENDVLNIVENFKPLSTSYTQVGNDKKNGAPKIDEGNLTPSSETTIANDANNPDNRAK